ncbi:MAG: DUF1232 domain-containing protein [Anaerolineae bacterium]|nr:DUF1232 domain-containing protein [Anaerolineae bacterium]
MNTKSSRDVGFFMRMWQQLRLAWALLSDSRVPGFYKLIPVLTIAYLLSPIDLIPDFLVGIGWLDDLGILLLGMSAFNNLAPNALVMEHLRRLGLLKQAPVQPTQRKDQGQGMVIDVKAEMVDDDEMVISTREAKRKNEG